jgi:nitrogen fixation negative regulator NifL
MKSDGNGLKGFNPFGEVCSLIAVALGALALWSWGAGVSDLFTPAVQRIPMAPSTALALVLISLAIFLRSRWPVQRWATWPGHVAAAIVFAAGLLACVRRWFGWNSSVEQWLAQTTDRIGNIPVGQMSPLTGALFVAAALAFLLRLLPPAQRSIAHRLSTVLALAVSLVGAGVAISYAVGRPWLAGSEIIPMAFWTATAFVFLGLALVGVPLVSSPQAGTGPPPSVDPASSVRARGSEGSSLPVVGLLMLIIGTLTAIYLRHEQTRDRANAREMLHAIGDLKLAQITSWRQERLNDARFFAQADFVSRDVSRFLEQPRSGPARVQLLHWLDLLKGGNRYSVVALFDTNAVRRLALPDRTNSNLAIPPALLAAALRSNQVVISDLHHSDDERRVHLDIVFPVSAPESSSTPALPRRGPAPHGAVLLRLDPRQFLYPLLQSWPTPSRSAETLLVRREGDEVIFLNELRHRTNSVLGLQFPLTPISDLPAARVVLGQTGQMEGRDYRGVPVLADVRPVPDSSWFLVAKVDRDEVYAPLRQHAWLTLALAAILALAAGLLAGLVSKRREAALTHRELASERQRLALAQRVEHLMKSANDAILLADEQDNILEANDRAQELYGYSLAELQAMNLPALRAPETRAEFSRTNERLMATGQAMFETLHQRKNGSIFPVEISSSVIEIDGVRYKLGVLRDISERQAHEREIKRLNRLYATLSQVNQAIVRVPSREQLFQDVCRIAVEFGGFEVAWIGWPDPETRQVKPVARAGDTEGYLDKIKVYTDDRPEGRGLVGLCLRTGKSCISNDVISDPRTAPWHAVAVAHGLRGAAALPIRFNGESRGVFTVYAGEPGGFQDKEIALLEEMAVDISYALEQLQQKELHQTAERALRESEELYRTLIGASPNAITLTDLTGRTVFTSAKALAMFGEEAAADLTGRNVLEWVAPEERERAQENVRRLPADGQFLETEYPMVRKDGTRFSAEVTVGVFRASDGSPKGKIIVTRDMTRRKQTQEREQLHLHTLQLLAMGASLPEVLESIATLLECGREDWRCAIMLVDASGRRLVHGAAPRLPEFYQQAIDGVEIGPGVGSCGTAAATKQLVVVEDVETHPYWDGFREVARRAGLRACWSQPVLSPGEEVLGTFAIYHAEPRVPTWEDVHAIAGVTRLASIAIEQRRAEQALRESEERLRLALVASQMGVWEWDLRTNAVFWSPECYVIAGLKQQEGPLTIETFTNLVHPEDRAQLVAAAEQAIANQTRFNVEFRLIRPDGGLRWLAHDARASYDAEGKPVRLVGTVQDITTRKLAEEQVRKLSRAVEQSPAAIVITNPAGDIEYVNPKFTQASGYTLDEVRGQNPRVLKSGETSPETYQQLWQAITQGREWSGEFHNRRKNGELYWEFARISPILDEAGRLTHFLAVKEDITERKRAGAALRESERRMREMMANVQLVTLMLDERGQILFGNDFLLQLTGWQTEEILGRDYFEIFIPAEVRDQLRQGFHSLIQGSSLAHYENEILTRTGQRRLIAWNNTSLKDVAGKIIGVASIGEDITDRKRQETQLRQSQKMEAIGQLASGVAHDFNNILAAFMMHLGLLQQRPDLDAELREGFKELEAGAQRAASLTRQLLLFSRRSVMQVQPLDVNEVVENLLKMLRRIIGEHIKLEWQGASQLPPVMADAGMLDQVVMNLVVNARDAMPNGGRLAIATEAVEVSEVQASNHPDVRPGSFVCLTVSDTGCGMDEAVRKRIFEPFFTTKEAGKGTGLGLATVYGMVSQHRGWISVESRVNYGSTFRVMLPAIARSVSETPAAIQERPVQGGEETILLVEDDLSVRQTLSVYLRRWGYQVLEAANGYEALELWPQHQHQVHLLFTDMVMPEGMTGLQLIERLRATKPGLPVIVCSGYSAELSQLDRLVAEGIVYVPKPCPPAELAVTVRRCLDQK